MAFQCPACSHDQVSTVVPAGDCRYALCAACASLYLHPMPDGGEGLPSGAASIAGWAERQVIGRLRRLGPAVRRVGANVSGRALCEAFELHTLRADARTAHVFDAIVLMQAIDRSAEPGCTVQALRRMLAPGGTLLVLTPNALFARGVLALKSRGRPARDDIGDILRPATRKVIYSARGITCLLQRNGFDQIGIRAAAPDLSGSTPRWLPVGLYLMSRAVQTLAPRTFLNHAMICSATRKD